MSSLPDSCADKRQRFVPLKKCRKLAYLIVLKDIEHNLSAIKWKGRSSEKAKT